MRVFGASFSCFSLIYLISLVNPYVCGREKERSTVASGSTSWELEMSCSFQLSNVG